MEDGENRTSFVNDIKITDGKTDIIYSALRVEKCAGVEKLSWFRVDGASVIIGH